MALFKKKPDPISDRARALSEEIASLEEQIKHLDSQLQHNQSQPRLRSTALPRRAVIQRSPDIEGRYSSATPKSGEGEKLKNGRQHEPVFEDVDQNRLKSQDDAASTPEHYNDLGVRKYDLPALIQRIKNHFRGPSTTNPKLVSYLAAGGVQGLRPMRYEKRVARNRFMLFAGALFLVLFGIFWWLAKHH